MTNFWIELQHNHKRPRATVELPSFARNVWLICYLSEQFFVLSFPIECEQIRELTCILLRKLPSRRTFWIVQGEVFWCKRHRPIKFRSHWIFLSGLSAVIRAYPALLELASDIEISCFPGRGGFSAHSQASLSNLFTESKVSFSSDVLMYGFSVFSSL